VTSSTRKVRLARLAITAMMHRLTLACAAASVLTCILAVFEPDFGFAHLKAHAPYMLGLVRLEAAALRGSGRALGTVRRPVPG
jgi:hypothetical protein